MFYWPTFEKASLLFFSNTWFAVAGRKAASSKLSWYIGNLQFWLPGASSPEKPRGFYSDYYSVAFLRPILRNARRSWRKYSDGVFRGHMFRSILWFATCSVAITPLEKLGGDQKRSKLSFSTRQGYHSRTFNQVHYRCGPHYLIGAYSPG